MARPHDPEEPFASIRDTHFFKSNNPLSRNEWLSLSATRQDIFASLEAVDEQLELLQMKRDRLRKLVEEYSIPLAPIRHVPRDVILCIFKELQKTWLRNDSFNLKSGPWTIAQVCSSWRSVALDTPLFWNTINIDLTRKIPPYSNSILSTIISRTKSVDLDITFKTKWMDPSTEHTFDCLSSGLLELLCLHSHRWRSLDATIPQSHWACFRQIEHTLPKLEVPSTDIVDEMTVLPGSRAKDTCTFFARAPKLNRVSLGMKHSAPFASLPMVAREFSIRLHSRYQHRLASVIPATVEKLTLAGWMCRSPTDAILTLPNATSLCAEGLTFCHITLPSLRHLHLSKLDPDESAIQELERFMNRSFHNKSKDCRLSTLYVSPSNRPFDAYSFLAPFSSIRRLGLGASYATSYTSLLYTMKPLLLQLTFSDYSRNVLPQLTTLEIDFSNTSCPRTRNLVFEVVRSREYLRLEDGCKSLEEFSYTDDLHESVTLETYNELWSTIVHEDGWLTGESDDDY